jgi:hypothetical protein
LSVFLWVGYPCTETPRKESQPQQKRAVTCEDRVLDGPASGEKGSNGSNWLDCIRDKGVPQTTTVAAMWPLCEESMIETLTGVPCLQENAPP